MLPIEELLEQAVQDDHLARIQDGVLVHDVVAPLVHLQQQQHQYVIQLTKQQVEEEEADVELDQVWVHGDLPQGDHETFDRRPPIHLRGTPAAQ